MAESVTEPTVRRSFRGSFYFWLAVVMAALVFSGFGITYLQPMATGSLAPLPPIVHLHGLFAFSWMVLLVTQAALVSAGNVRLHRSLGTFGIAVAAGIVITGTLITLLFSAAQPVDMPHYHDLMYLGLIAVVTFAGLFIMAIRQTRNPDEHRRYILFATIPWLPPGINRLYQNGFDLEGVPVLATYLTMDLLVAALLLNDWRTRKAFTRAGLIGAVCVLMPQVLHYPIVESDAFVGFSRMLADLVYYR